MVVLIALSVNYADAQNTVDWSYTLNSLGGNEYQYVFNFTNLGPSNDAIFKLQIFDLPSGATTVSTSEPTGWSGSQNGNHLDFQTSNGSLSTSQGLYRIWGNAAAPIGAGNTSGVFDWEFTDLTAPSATNFANTDVTVHVQQIGSNWSNNGSSYTVAPGSPPVTTPEASSGLLALLPCLAGVGRLLLLKIRE
jgi:hypothetical protein